MENDSKQSKINEKANYVAAIDMGSNTCRLLIARPYKNSYKIVDSFSRVIRLGAGTKTSNQISTEAAERALNALEICASKLAKYNVKNYRAVATEACRRAKNSNEFIDTVKNDTGIELEVITEYEEACLALKGCRGLVDNTYNYVLGFDIGGCSTEVMWSKNDGMIPANNILDWISIPYGIVSLIDSSGGDPLVFYDEIRQKVKQALSSIKEHKQIVRLLEKGDVQVIGSSGTTTTVGALYLELPYYDRIQVDGTILPVESIHSISDKMRQTPARDRITTPCIGPGRGDVVVGGLAILQGICDTWPIKNITVADRGVRDGILADLLRSVKSDKSVA